TGGKRLDFHPGVAAKAHDGAFAELLGDGGEREIDVFFARGVGDGRGDFGGGGFGHGEKDGIRLAGKLSRRQRGCLKTMRAHATHEFFTDEASAQGRLWKFNAAPAS